MCITIFPASIVTTFRLHFQPLFMFILEIKKQLEMYRKSKTRVNEYERKCNIPLDILLITTSNFCLLVHKLSEHIPLL